MRVFLLGAGASKSYDQSPTQVRMPVARDFFQTFDQLDISANPWVLQEGLLGYLLSKGISDPGEYLRAGIDIEDLHSEIEEKRNAAIRGGLSLIEYYHENRAYNELSFLFCSVINEIQNGPISEPYKELARQLQNGDAVITFNWDTLLDRALASETSWNPDIGYGVSPKGIFRDGWSKPISSGHTEIPQLIKLHGSTNWLTAYSIVDEDGHTVLTHDLDPGTLHVFEFASKPYACFNGRYMAGYEPYSYGYYPPNFLDVPGRPAKEGHVILKMTPTVPWRAAGQASGEGLVTAPLIIPPVKQKSYELFGSLFLGLWLEAENVLAKADEIIIIGYSFPRTDIQSNDLFTRAFMRRSSLPKLTIVDPMPVNVAQKFSQDFGIPGSNLKVMKTFFTKEFDWNEVFKN
jgi:hypothetical protein